jgi:hypothetical protein
VFDKPTETNSMRDGVVESDLYGQDEIYASEDEFDEDYLINNSATECNFEAKLEEMLRKPCQTLDQLSQIKDNTMIEPQPMFADVEALGQRTAGESVDYGMKAAASAVSPADQVSNRSTQDAHGNVTWPIKGSNEEIDYGKKLYFKENNVEEICPHFDNGEDDCILFQVKSYILNGNNKLKAEDFSNVQVDWWNRISADGLMVQPPGVCKSCRAYQCGIDRKSNIELLERHILKSSCMYDEDLKCMKLKYAKNAVMDMKKILNNGNITYGSAQRLYGRVAKLEQDSQDSFNRSLNDAVQCVGIKMIEDLYAQFPEMVNHPKRFLEPNFSFSGKQSSKCRPTFNSSASYSEQDIAQNSLFLKGGNINELIRCFLAFRLHEYGSSIDLSRAFYS